MNKNRSFFESLKCAANGIYSALKNERNLRFDFSAMLTVAFFGVFCGLNGTEWAVVFLAFAAVIGAELSNTALESLCDAVTEEYSEKIGSAKDAASGAVIFCAVMSAAAGVMIFTSEGRFFRAVSGIFSNAAYAVVFCVLLVLNTVCLFKNNRKD